MSQTKPRLEVLVGMIASGKSTYCSKAAANGAIIVNDDALITALHGGHYHYDRGIRPVYKTVQAGIVRTALLAKLNVVVDSTNLSVRTRRKWIELAREMDATPVAMVFAKASPAEHALRRFRSDSRGASKEAWLEVAEAHDAEFEPVTGDEPFVEINFVP